MIVNRVNPGCVLLAFSGLLLWQAAGAGPQHDHGHPPAAQHLNDHGDPSLAEHMLLPIFDILDCTGQGFLEAGEVDEHFPNLFGYHDIDRDRRLTLTEFQHKTDKQKQLLDERLFRQMDRDRDNFVSTREYRDTLIDIIQSVDADGDGETTMAELVAESETATPEAAGGTKAGGDD
ncbi:MAG: hypothetical protein AAGF72_06370 [Pseudomonadota bacterium]